MESSTISVNASNKVSSKASILGWIRFLFLIATILFVFKYVVGIMLISGNSMNPTLQDKSVVLINKTFVNAERGDIIVVKDPNGYNIIKRVVALPNETIEIKDGIVYINGEKKIEDYTLGVSFDIPETRIPEGDYFIIGDNRAPGESLDSRDGSIGPIPEQNIIGNAMFSLFPFGSL